MNLSTILVRRIDFIPDKRALIFKEKTVSSTIFCTCSAQIARVLALLGITTGDRVVVLTAMGQVQKFKLQEEFVMKQLMI